ncbi:MAG: DUF819 family protein [Planctomycetes bacterium]|nr:DUF819 family protein [Planctomycetota bacterium]
MIDSAAGFAAAVLALAGLFPVLAARWPRPFAVVPPIVWSYVATTLLAMAGAWADVPGIAEVRREASARLLPALVFLLMVQCDLRGILGLGPRALAAFACAAGSIVFGLGVAWRVWHGLLPPQGWQAVGCLAGSWVGGTANLYAVGQATGAAPAMVGAALVVDTICYAAWVALLFATVPFADRFDRWSGAARIAVPTPVDEPSGPTTPGHALLWLAAALTVGNAAALAAPHLPADGPLTPATWTLLLVSLAGLAVAPTPLARIPGAGGVGAALLAVAVVSLASAGDVQGLAAVGWLVAVGFTALAIHGLLLAAAARAFGLELALVGIASLASVGGIASTPLLAAAHRRELVPVAVLLALLGYLLGTWAGIGLTALLSPLAGAAS